MLTTFESAKVGDRVYSPTFGWGEITSINHMSTYPIKVYFSWYNVPESFTIEGYYYSDLPLQSLFWDEVYIEAPAKPVGVKVINDVEVPDISFKPTKGEVFLYPSIDV